MFVWNKIQSFERRHKPVALSGKFSNPSTEELLIGTRGQTEKYLRPNVSVNQLVTAPVTRHSEKPS